MERLTIAQHCVFVLCWCGFGLSANAEYSQLQTLRAPTEANQRSPVVTAVRLHPNGRILVSAGDDQQVRIWDWARSRQIRILSGHEDWIAAIAFSPNGKLLASAGKDGRVFLWELATGRRQLLINRERDSVAAVEFSGSGKKLAHVGFDHVIEIHDATTGRSLVSFDAPSRDLRALAWARDDSFLVGGGRSGMLVVVDPSTGNRIAAFPAHKRRIRAVLVSRSNREIITAGEDGRIRFWNAKSFTMDREITTGKSKVLSMVELDGDRLATGGTDNNITIWDTITGKRIHVLQGHAGSVVALDFQQGILVSGSYDTTVRVWKVEDDSLVARLNRTDRP